MRRRRERHAPPLERRRGLAAHGPPDEPDGDQLGAAVRRAARLGAADGRRAQRAWSSAIPRFRQRVVESRLPLRRPHWQEDPDFALARHMHRRGAAGAGRRGGAEGARGRPRRRRRWTAASRCGTCTWSTGPATGCAVIVRMHHCIADGIALARVMLSLTDTAPRRAGGAPARERGERARRRRRAGAAASIRRRRWRPLGRRSRRPGVRRRERQAGPAADREGAETLAHPAPRARARRRARAPTRGRWRSCVLHARATRASALKGEPGATRSVAWSRPLSLERVKAIAHAQGATVNDVLLAAVSGALRDYLQARGEEPRGDPHAGARQPARRSSSRSRASWATASGSCS